MKAINLVGKAIITLAGDVFAFIRDFIWAILGILLVIALIGGLIGSCYYMDWQSCHETGEAMGREVRWSKTPGVPCMVRGDNGEWFPLDQFREENP